MVSFFSQMFLSALYVFVLVTSWFGSLLCVLSLSLLFLLGYFFGRVCFSLLRECGGNGWTQLLYYIAELCLSYY